MSEKQHTHMGCQPEPGSVTAVHGIWKVQLLLIAATVFMICSGCASASLKLPLDFNAVVRRQPASIALGSIQDSVSCDDEAFYLQRYLEKKDVFYDCVLADQDNPHAYHGADILLSGRIEPRVGWSQGLGWGHFATFITMGGYYFLVGPTRKQEARIDYNFDVYFTDTGKTNSFHFYDLRKAYFGFYGPRINMDRKPELYEAGWDQLLYEICREMQNRRAGKQ